MDIELTDSGSVKIWVSRKLYACFEIMPRDDDEGKCLVIHSNGGSLRLEPQAANAVNIFLHHWKGE